MFAQEELTVPLGGGFIRAAFTSNGRVDIVASSSATGVVTTGLFINNGTTTYTNINEGNGVHGHNGAILGSSTERTNYWLMYPEGTSSGTPLDSIRIVQTDAASTPDATTGTVTASPTTVSVNGGTGLFNVTANGRWRLRASTSATNPAAGTFSSDLFEVSQGSGDGFLTGGFTWNSTNYTRQANVGLFLVLTPQDSNTILDTVRISGTGGRAENIGIQVVSTLPANPSPGVIYITTS